MCETESLIISVEKHPCLWDVNNEDFHSKDMRDLAWEQVCNEVINDWETCTDKVNKSAVLKKRWTHVRDYYRKYLQKIKNGNGAQKYKKYVYANILYFLEPIFDDSRSSSKPTEDDMENSKPEMREAKNLKQEYRLKREDDIKRSPSPEPPKQKNKEINKMSLEIFNAKYKTIKQEVSIENDGRWILERSPSPEPPKQKKQRNKQDAPGDVQYLETGPQLLNISKQRDERNTDKDEDDDTNFLLSFRTYMRQMNMRQKIDFQLGMLQLVKKSLRITSTTDNPTGGSSSPVSEVSPTTYYKT